MTESHLISTIQSGQTKEIDDIKTATVETFETLGDVFKLYRTFAKGTDADGLLGKFDFIMVTHHPIHRLSIH
jgi:hypothetical protein